jgi:(S)-3,5-dihydroxyphenylglycine transaminase
MDIDLKSCFGDPLLEVMNFLNEVVLRYPQAISFAPGRPAERHFDVERSLAQTPAFVAHRAAATGWPPLAVWNDLGQYNKTNGIINDLVARQLELDEGIRVRPESIMITQGCQEAMTVLLLGLFDPARDVLLVSDPTYIGITGLADILGIEMVPVPTGDEGLAADAVAAAVAGVRRAGKRPRALYDIPDFNNPLGTQMPLAARHALLGVLRAEGVLLFEDNPYGMFSYDGDPLPTLKALDEHGVVIYLGSFSKTLYPGLRAGYLVADQEVVGASGQRTSLAAELSKVKSLTTVTTAPVIQAVVGAQLIENGGSLRDFVRGKLPFYKGNRDCMLACLERDFGGRGAGGGIEGVRWNRPAGGFFLTVQLPFAFDDACLQDCARDYGVVVCPMSYFALSPGRESQVRISFSYVDEAQIEEGIRRFARFVNDRVARVARAGAAVPASLHPQDAVSS